MDNLLTPLSLGCYAYNEYLDNTDLLVLSKSVSIPNKSHIAPNYSLIDSHAVDKLPRCQKLFSLSIPHQIG